MSWVEISSEATKPIAMILVTSSGPTAISARMHRIVPVWVMKTQPARCARANGLIRSIHGAQANLSTSGRSRMLIEPMAVRETPASRMIGGRAATKR